MIVIRKFFCIILLLVSEISFAAKVKELTCSHGIKFWYHHDNTAPIVNLAIAFKNSGSAHLKKEIKALPDLYINTVFCGCGNYSKEEFQEKIQNISVRPYGEANLDNIIFFFKYPKIVSKEALDLFKVMLNSPLFPKKEVEKAKFALCGYLDDYQINPISWGAHILFNKLLFKDHPYGIGLGNSEDILKLGSEDLRDFHKKYIVRSNVELCIFGDISEQEAKKLADNLLSSIPKGEKSIDNVSDIKIKFENIKKNYHVPGSQSYILFALPGVLRASPDKFALSVLYLILGGGNFKSHILKNLRTKQGLIYSGYLSSIYKTHANFEVGVLKTSNKNAHTAIDQIKLLLKNLKQSGITEDELAFAKSNIKGTFLVNLRTAEDLCYYYMMSKLRGYSTNVMEETLQGIDSVTLNQVNAVAKKFLNENHLPILVFGEDK